MADKDAHPANNHAANGGHSKIETQEPESPEAKYTLRTKEDVRAIVGEILEDVTYHIARDIKAYAEKTGSGHLPEEMPHLTAMAAIGAHASRSTLTCLLPYYSFTINKMLQDNPKITGPAIRIDLSVSPVEVRASTYPVFRSIIMAVFRTFVWSHWDSKNKDNLSSNKEHFISCVSEALKHNNTDIDRAACEQFFDATTLALRTIQKRHASAGLQHQGIEEAEHSHKQLVSQPLLDLLDMRIKETNASDLFIASIVLLREMEELGHAKEDALRNSILDQHYYKYVDCGALISANMADQVVANWKKIRQECVMSNKRYTLGIALAGAIAETVAAVVASQVGALLMHKYPFLSKEQIQLIIDLPISAYQSSIADTIDEAAARLVIDRQIPGQEYGIARVQADVFSAAEKRLIGILNWLAALIDAILPTAIAVLREKLTDRVDLIRDGRFIREVINALCEAHSQNLRHVCPLTNNEAPCLESEDHLAETREEPDLPLYKLGSAISSAVRQVNQVQVQHVLC